MAHDRRLEVAGINIRIVDETKRDYYSLLSKLFSLRQVVPFYGSDYVMITQFAPSTNGGVDGVISRFAQIDPSAGWLDLDKLRTASKQQTDEIQIPENLRPNHRPFYFSWVDQKHFMVFETLSSGQTLSPNFLAKALRKMVKHPEVVGEFGSVQIDIISSKQVIEEIIRSPSLKELHIIVKRTNQDDVGRDWIEKIDRELEEQRLRREERRLLAERNQYVQPNSENAAFARYASENGRVDARIEQGGVSKPISTVNHPETEPETYNREVPQTVAFTSAVARFVDRVIRGRDDPDVE